MIMAAHAIFLSIGFKSSSKDKKQGKYVKVRNINFAHVLFQNW